ncbi:MAG: hypothetical protein JXA87_08235 [Thermoleophilia bacterium]|nr:hypothetical protein [Thermoleophilia bacterium]
MRIGRGVDRQAKEHEGWHKVLAPMAVSVVMVFVFVWLFGAALHRPEPHDIVVGFVGPPAVAEKVGAAVEISAPGAFTLVAYGSADEARGAIEERDIAGALVVGLGQPRILVAGAGGQAASGAISGVFSALAQAFGQPAAVEDVQPLPESDSRGLVPFFLVLGVSVSAFLFQVLSRERTGRQSLLGSMGSMLVFALVDGLAAALAVGIVIGFGSYWPLAGVCVLLALAVTAATAACCRLFGKGGVGVAGLIVILLGNASSGSVIGSAFLPQPFRWLSPVLPAGSALEAVRSVLYFGGAGAGWRVATLALWVAGSFVILACVALRRVRSMRPAEATI